MTMRYRRACGPCIFQAPNLHTPGGFTLDPATGLCADDGCASGCGQTRPAERQPGDAG